MSLNAAEFEYIRKLVKDKSSISLEPTKEYLILSRLEPLAKKEGFTSLADLVVRLRTEPHNGLHGKVVEAMTTNETSFFRDFNPFEAMRKTILPDFMSKRQKEKQLNIWCAACSSGQEPYSMIMMMKEQFPSLMNWQLRILCTDISKEMLQKCRNGKYSQLEVNRGLPAPYLIKYFRQQGCEWQLSEEVRKLAEFREMNLAEAWPVMPPMDLIFIRNVMIYFEVDVKKQILARVRRLLKPDGYLVLGGAETTINLDDNFERVQIDGAGFYRLKAQENIALKKAA